MNVDVTAAISSVAVRYDVTDTAGIADDGTLTLTPVVRRASSTVIGMMFMQGYN